MTIELVNEPSCINCGEPFSPENTHSPAGWKETEISGLCEDCFDLITTKEEEEGDDDGPPL